MAPLIGKVGTSEYFEFAIQVRIMIADNQHMVNAMHCNELQSHAGPAERCRALPERQWEASVLGRLNTLIDGIGVFVSSDCGSNGGGNVASATCRSANIAKCPQNGGTARRF